MSFKDIIGQAVALRILRGMLKQGRLPHALLFTGEPGVGKLFTAKELLKAINCKNSDEEFNPCDNCRNCRLIESFNFPDLFFIKPEGEQIKVETIREINEFLNMTPYEGSTKMVLINEADKLNISAANAFLKTLEEPPRDSIIILITEKPDLLPDTIRSRCVRIAFTPLSKEETSEVLKRLRPAAFPATPVTFATNFEALIEGRPGIIMEEDFGEYIEVLKYLLQESPKSFEEDFKKERLMIIIELLLIYLRDRMVELINKNSATVTFTTNFKQFEQTDNSPSSIGGQSNSGRLEGLQVIIEKYRKLLHIRELMQFNLNPKITWNYIKTIIV
ncbi:MAG: DNA polymerase III subunit delta' [Thermodesulfovibrionales bacterium]